MEKTPALRFARGIPGAFSLVEVTIALGLAAFVLVALMGLVNIAIGTGQDASNKSILARITQDTLSSLPQRDWKEAGSDANENFERGYAALKRIADASGEAEVYFDHQGAETDQPGECLYVGRITPHVLPDPLGQVLSVRIDFEWPYTAPPANRSRTTVTTAVANYD